MIQFISHQPINFTYNLNTCEVLSDHCLQYQLSDVVQFQFKNTIDDCGFFIGIRPVGSIATPTEISDYTVSGTFVTATIDFTSLELSAGCYEVALYEVCTDNANNKIVNGRFNTDLSGWVVADALTLDIASFTMTSVTLISTGGTGPVTYKLNSGSYQVSNVFPGLTTGVQYTFTVKDANNITTTIVFTIRSCGSYAGAYLYDMDGVYLSEIGNCYLFDFT